jgi:hypothetical protein
LHGFPLFRRCRLKKSYGKILLKSGSYFSTIPLRNLPTVSYMVKSLNPFQSCTSWSPEIPPGVPPEMPPEVLPEMPPEILPEIPPGVPPEMPPEVPPPLP